MHLGIGLGITRLSGVLVSAPPAFSPLDLFGSGEEGAWYDPSDLSTVWQDAAGTTPATAGDPVGRIDDKSGNGNHATQSTSAARPTLQVSGGLYYLDFDGVDDHLLAASVNFTGFTELQVLAGAQKDSDATVQRVFDLAGTGPTYSIQIPGNIANLSSGLTVSNGSFVAAATACDAAPNLYLFNAYSDLSAPLVGFQFDQDAEVELTSSLGSTYADFGSSRTIHIGQRSNNSSRMNGGFYGMIIRSVLLDATQLSDAQSYLATKSGVTLP